MPATKSQLTYQEQEVLYLLATGQTDRKIAELVYQQDGQEQVLPVDTASWFAWLETASTFSFVSEEGRFTTRREQADHKRGGWYWKT